MGRPKILLIQLPIPPLGPQPIRGNVPLAAGYLKLLARQRGLEEYFDIEILPADDANRMGDQALIGEIASRRPWMIGFTCYLWNIDRTLWVARQIKEQQPQTLVVVGGPEITPDNAWVLESPYLDFAAIGEGEQTFSELLAWYAAGIESHLARGADSPLAQSGRFGASDIPSGIRGLAHRIDGRMVQNPPRSPMPSLDAISSPYLAGILDAGDQEQLLLETVRGCVFKCKFCYYPKAYDGLYYVSAEKILANLSHARQRGAREVYLLDPTLNQRRDFTEFLELLKAGNPDGQLELHAELRAEGITPAQARLMREANFKEVEIGLQSIDPTTQDLMDRRNNLKAFEKGVRALQAEGIRVKVDLIVGLPGDTVDSVRRGMHYLADGRLYDDIQVFQLSILPGTSFRHEAAQLGLEYQRRPPYYVLRTPTLALDDMLGVLEESEDIFQTEFDAPPPPALDIAVMGTQAIPPPAERRSQNELSGWRIDLDCDSFDPLPSRAAEAFTLWFQSARLYRQLPRAAQAVREFVASNPFATLQIVLETTGEFPFDVFDQLSAAARRPVNMYLDRFYEFTPGRPAGAQRIVVLLPGELRSGIDPAWLADSLPHADIVWHDGAGVGGAVVPVDRPGEWQWTETRAFNGLMVPTRSSR